MWPWQASTTNRARNRFLGSLKGLQTQALKEKMGEKASVLCWNFQQSMGARNRVEIGLSYRPELVPWNRFLGSLRLKIRALKRRRRGQGLLRKKQKRIKVQFETVLDRNEKKGGKSQEEIGRRSLCLSFKRGKTKMTWKLED
jgi:hypothetical protein